MDINTFMLYLVGLDAIALLVIGLVLAGLILLDREVTDFVRRLFQATGVLIGTSLASGLVMWVGSYLFGG